MVNPLIVSRDKWRDGIKFLMGLGANSALTVEDQRKLRKCFERPGSCPPHNQGMPSAQAERTLREVIGWDWR